MGPACCSTQAEQQAVEREKALETLQLAKELLVLDYKVCAAAAAA